MDYRRQDRAVWNDIFRQAAAAWLEAEPSRLMSECAEFLRRHRTRRVLDLGCGFGRWTNYVSETAGCAAVGVDYAVGGARLGARLAGPSARSAFVAGEITALPFADDTFDGFLAVLILDNVAVPEGRAAVGELERVVRPGSPGFVVLNPWPMPQGAGAADNPTRDCTRHDYGDDEAREVLLGGWEVASWRRAEHGLRAAEVRVAPGGAR